MKFRVFDNESKAFTRGHSISVDQDGILYIAQEHGLTISKPDEDQFVIQLFTGFFDQNGKEIYEGDILEYNYNGEDTERCVVRYGTGYFDGQCYAYRGFYLENQYNEKLEPREISSLTKNDDTFFFTVIGNICESPNLLNR